MAVKEIVFENQNEIDCIRLNEIILTLLHHPNVCLYYGVEIHRDRVNILSKYY